MPNGLFIYTGLGLAAELNGLGAGGFFAFPLETGFLVLTIGFS